MKNGIIKKCLIFACLSLTVAEIAAESFYSKDVCRTESVTAKVLVVNLMTNQIVGSVNIEKGNGTVGVHVTSNGVYAVSLIIGNNSLSDTKKCIVTK